MGSSVKVALYLLVLSVCTWVVYTPALKAKFTINWDDDRYVTLNKDITTDSEEAWHNLLTKPYAENYHPLTMLSLKLDYTIGKLRPSVYHRTNLLIHIGSALLVFWLVLLWVKNKEVALLCALVFAVHPLNVESVAWVSERKNVLYGFFFLASLVAYQYYSLTSKWLFYLFSILLFVMSLLSKGMAVSLSVTLIAIDLFNRREVGIWKLCLEKLPFFFLSFFFGFLAIHHQPTEVSEIDIYSLEPVLNPWYDKLLIATHNLAHYLYKLLLPIDLVCLYPYPTRISGFLPWHFYVVPPFILAGLCYVVVRLWKMRHQYSMLLLLGLAVFVLNIALLLQLLPVGIAIMADRYAYIPSVGFSLFLGVGYWYAIEKKAEFKNVVLVLLAVYVVFLSVLAHERTKVWKDSLSLWSDLNEKEDFAFGYFQTGVAKSDLEDYEGALKDYQTCIQKDARAYKAYNNIGIILAKKGQYAEAIRFYDKVIQLYPAYADAYLNRGTAKHQAGDYEGAMSDYNAYLKYEPKENAGGYLVRGYCFATMGKYTEAIADYDQAISINPELTEAYNKRAFSYFMLENTKAAFADFDKCIALDPANPEYYVNRGIVNSVLNQVPSAFFDFGKAIDLNPSYAVAYHNRAKTYMSVGEGNKACADFQKASQLGHAEARADMSRFCR
jgi:protein O-mannosyl-transferase